MEEAVSQRQRQWILDRFNDFKGRPSLVVNGNFHDYNDISQNVIDWLHAFEERKLRPCVVIVIGDYSEKTFGAILALYIKGCITVPLHTANQETIGSVEELSCADFVVDTTSAVFRPLRQTSAEKHPLIIKLLQAGEPGLILLSSGSTGTPKAMLLSMERLFEKYRHIEQYKTYVTAAFLLFDHIGGFNTLVHTLFNGGVLVKLESRDPRYVCEAIEKYGIELLPTTPTFLNMMLIGKAYEKCDCSSLKFISYGTEVMPESTLKTVASVLPDVELKQTYGMSELGILPTKSRSRHSSWMKIGDKNVLTKVIDGILWVKARTAMLGYLNAPSPFDSDGWLCTGDMVENDGEYVKIMGRKETIINVGGLKVYPAEVENRILTLAFVKDVVVWGKKSPVTGQIVAATIVKREPLDDKLAKQRVIQECRKTLEEYKVPKYIRFSEQSLYNERFKKINKDIPGV